MKGLSVGSEILERQEWQNNFINCIQIQVVSRCVFLIIHVERLWFALFYLKETVVWNCLQLVVKPQTLLIKCIHVSVELVINCRGVEMVVLVIENIMY